MQGWGKLRSATEVEVDTADGGTTVLSTKNVIIATGSEVTPLPGVPVDERRCGQTAALPLRSHWFPPGCAPLGNDALASGLPALVWHGYLRHRAVAASRLSAASCLPPAR